MKQFFYITPWVLQTFIWIPTRIILRIFFCYEVEGLEDLKELKNNKNGVIFASNHISELDPGTVPASLPFLSGLMPIFYVSRGGGNYKLSGWKQVFYGGLIFRLWGAHPAYLGLNNYEMSLRDHIEILNKGKSLSIFPEGGKTKDGKVGEGKGGVAFLSHRTHSPIVPVKIKGLWKTDNEKDSFGRKKIKVIFGKPLYSNKLFNGKEDASIEELKKVTKIIMQSIRDLN